MKPALAVRLGSSLRAVFRDGVARQMAMRRLPVSRMQEVRQTRLNLWTRRRTWARRRLAKTRGYAAARASTARAGPGKTGERATFSESSADSDWPRRITNVCSSCAISTTIVRVCMLRQEDARPALALHTRARMRSRRERELSRLKRVWALIFGPCMRKVRARRAAPSARAGGATRGAKAGAER